MNMEYIKVISVNAFKEAVHILPQVKKVIFQVCDKTIGLWYDSDMTLLTSQNNDYAREVFTYRLRYEIMSQKILVSDKIEKHLH